MSSASDSEEFFDAKDSWMSPTQSSAKKHNTSIDRDNTVRESTQAGVEVCKHHVAEDAECHHSLEAVRNMMAGKTAPASLMLTSHVCMNGTCVGLPGLDGNVATVKPYSSAPNIDLLHHTEAGLLTRSKEAEDILQVKKCGIDKQQGRSIPEIIVVCSDEASGTVEPCVHGDEPDIVQSTKSSSLPRHGVVLPLQPVAPPRRKKTKTPSPLHADAAAEGEVLQPAGLPVDDLSPAADMMLDVHVPVLPGSEDGSEPALDIGSATRGNRLVSTSQESADEAVAPIPCNLDDIQEKEASECRGLLKAASYNSLEFLVPLQHNSAAEDTDDEGYSVPLSMRRPRSDSGSRFLTDDEILEKVYVVNLDTGESVPLNSAEEKIPRCVNPLSLHIMRRTKEYQSDSSLPKTDQSDNEALRDPSPSENVVKTDKRPSRRRKKIKQLFGKTVQKIKTYADEVFHAEETASDDDESVDGRRIIKVKASNSHKGPYDFDLMVPVQELTTQKMSAVWTMKFSQCGRLLATGGQDNLLHIWTLKSAFTHFDEMRRKYSKVDRVSPTPSQDSQTTSHQSSDGDTASAPTAEEAAEADDEHAPFTKEPFCVYKGHTADLLDISWSKNYFILSSSMDKTVRLWHISRRECLCCFQHIDFVTAIAFHPKDDRYFLSGSLDGKLRLWNIPDKKVALWNEVGGATKLITAANFCLNGRFAVVGTYDGRCIFYVTDNLKYYTQINVRSTRGRNARGRKISGVEPFPGEDKVLVTSNDSRVRLYDLRDLTLTCKYKGCTNNSSQIKASFSHDGQFIICGSEDQSVYIWRTQHEFYKFSSARRDRNDYWESVKAHSAVVTNAIFAPRPELIIRSQFEYVDDEDRDSSAGVRGEVLVSADYAGLIRIFINKFKPGSG